MKHATLEELAGEFHRQTAAYLDGKDLACVARAEELMRSRLTGLTRMSGDPFAVHAYQVALTLTALKTDRTALETALLLAPFAKGRITREELAAQEGLDPRTPFLLENTVTLSRHNFRRGNVSRAESFRKLILTLAKDVRVILVKLADKLNSLRTLQYLGEDDQREIAQEAMDIYAPLANRLGIHRIKSEMEDLAFRFLYPERYQDLKSRVAVKKSERDAYIEQVSAKLHALVEDNGIEAQIKGRAKHFWSISRKMEAKHLDFDDLFDIIAFRIIVATIPQCYQLLGLVHAAWRPIPGTFDDYIAMPKPNGYQSLHTAVVGPDGQRMEVQIRTLPMDEIAENGVAAHWRYKEQGSTFQRDTIQRFGWLHQALSAGQDGFDQQLLESLRTDLFDDEVFVFTPKGDVRELPKGATALDFAYAVHTQVGHTCVGAKVNGRIQPLNHELFNGDIVEIMTNARSKPSKDWVSLVKTDRALQKVRHALSEEARARDKTLGRETLERFIKEHGGKPAKVLKDEGRIAKACDHFKQRGLDSLCLEVARGKLPVEDLAFLLEPELKKVQETAEKEDIASLVDAITAKPLRKQTLTGSGIVVAGVEGMMVRYAGCCNPVVGDAIVGFITRGRGVTIHREDCERIPVDEPQRLVEVHWGVDSRQTMPVRLRIEAKDRSGLLALVSDVFKKVGLNVVSASLDSKDGLGVALFTVEIHTVEELQRAVSAIKNTRGVTQVRRVADAMPR